MAPSGCPSTAAAQSEMCKWQQHSLSLCLAEEWIFKAPSCFLCLQQQQQLLRQRKQSIYIAITTHTHTQFTVSQSFACFLCPLNECVSLSLLVYVSAFNLQIAKLLLLLDVQKSAWVLFPFLPSFCFCNLSSTRRRCTNTHTHTILSVFCNSIRRGQYSIFIFVVLLYLSLSRTFISSFWVEFVWQHIAEWPSTLEESFFLGTNIFCVFCWRAFHHLDDPKPESRLNLGHPLENRDRDRPSKLCDQLTLNSVASYWFTLFQ